MKKQIFAYNVLDLDKSAGFTVNDSAYLAIDNILKDCKNNIVVKEAYSEQEAKQILQTINWILINQNFRSDDCCGISFSEALVKGVLNCCYYTYIYFSIAEILNLPLYAMLAPIHIFIVWHNESYDIYWESTYGVDAPLASFIECNKIPKRSIDNKCFLALLTINETYSEVYNNRGLVKDSLGRYHSAIRDYSKALKMNPNNDRTYLYRGNAKNQLSDKKGAFRDYCKAIELNQNNFDAYYICGILKQEEEDYDSAIYYYNHAIVINTDDADAYRNRGSAKADIGDLNGACSDWKKASELGLKEADEMIKEYCK